MAATEGYTIDDDLALPPLLELGIDVDTLCWDQSDVDWSRYDLVVVRSTWDYPAKTEQFLATLAEIDASDTLLENELSLMRWNLDKGYLRDLEAQGIATIPTLWRDRLQPGDLPRLLQELGTESMIIKPVVGAGAHGAWHLNRDNLAARSQEVEVFYQDRPLLAQAFVDSVISEGEYSLIYFDGEFSHALLKTPKPGDFRSQEEFGSQLRPITPDATLRGAGNQAMITLPHAPLYARVDLVHSNQTDTYWLIELELVEPSLYFSLDSAAPQRFAQALAHRLP